MTGLMISLVVKRQCTLIGEVCFGDTQKTKKTKLVLCGESPRWKMVLICDVNALE